MKREQRAEQKREGGGGIGFKGCVVYIFSATGDAPLNARILSRPSFARWIFFFSSVASEISRASRNSTFISLMSPKRFLLGNRAAAFRMCRYSSSVEALMYCVTWGGGESRVWVCGCGRLTLEFAARINLWLVFGNLHHFFLGVNFSSQDTFPKHYVHVAVEGLMDDVFFLLILQQRLNLTPSY